MIDVVQLLVRFMAAADVHFMDHIFVFQMFIYNFSSFILIALRTLVYIYAETLMPFLSAI